MKSTESQIESIWELAKPINVDEMLMAMTKRMHRQLEMQVFLFLAGYKKLTGNTYISLYDLSHICTIEKQYLSSGQVCYTLKPKTFEYTLHIPQED